MKYTTYAQTAEALDEVQSFVESHQLHKGRKQIANLIVALGNVLNEIDHDRGAVDLSVVVGDITDLAEHVDVIVNAAKSSLMGGGGVDGAIHAAAGPALKEECKLLRETVPELAGGLPIGDAAMTGAGKLDANWVAHVVGPVWPWRDQMDLEAADQYDDNVDGGVYDEQSELLGLAYANAIELAEAHGAESIVFPLVSSGIYGWPLEDAIRIAVGAIRDTGTHMRVMIVTRSDDTADLIQAELDL